MSSLHFSTEKKRERSERHMIENDQRSKFYLIKVSKLASDMNPSSRPLKSAGANFFSNEKYEKKIVHLRFLVVLGPAGEAHFASCF